LIVIVNLWRVFNGVLPGEDLRGVGERNRAKFVPEIVNRYFEFTFVVLNKELGLEVLGDGFSDGLLQILLKFVFPFLTTRIIKVSVLPHHFNY